LDFRNQAAQIGEANTKGKAGLLYKHHGLANLRVALTTSKLMMTIQRMPLHLLLGVLAPSEIDSKMHLPWAELITAEIFQQQTLHHLTYLASQMPVGEFPPLVCQVDHRNHMRGRRK
jgi:hypothetical protein